MTKMQLLKLIYFSHGWYLARRDRPLVNNSFEAWENGPVVRIVYDAFSLVRSSKAIKNRARKFDPFTGQFADLPHVDDNDDKEFISRIFDVYGKVSAFRLSAMTHVTGGPWDRVWNAPDGEVFLGMGIPNSLIQQYFLDLNRRERTVKIW